MPVPPARSTRSTRQAAPLNLTHGPIDALGWPGMTMDFAVLPSIDLGALKAGETIAFTVAQTPEGTYAVDSVTPAK